jgi:hypothetical protein
MCSVPARVKTPSAKLIWFQIAQKLTKMCVESRRIGFKEKSETSLDILNFIEQKNCS